MISGNDRLIVVLGMAHSGTTILTYVLKQHPEVLCVSEGSEAWLLENSYLPLEQAEPIEKWLRQLPDKRILLKRPWNEVHHAEWMMREMPNAKFIYCYRHFSEISKSWLKPTSLVDDRLRNDGITYQLEIYKTCLEKAQIFGRSVPCFYNVYHPNFVENPKKVIDEITAWAGLRPFKFDVSEVSRDKNIKQLLCGRY